jgi:hypothetical protein
MFARRSLSFSKPNPSNPRIRRGKIPASEGRPLREEKRRGSERDYEPGMFMKKQAISEFSGLFDGGARNPFLENKEVVSTFCRLSMSKNRDRKIKV